MRLKKLTSWSGTRGSKVRRQVEKEKSSKGSRPSSPNSPNSPNNNLGLDSSPIRSLKHSPGFGTSPNKGEGEKPATSETDRGVLRKHEDDRPCLLFEDVEDEDDEDMGYAKNIVAKEIEANNSAVKDKKLNSTENIPTKKISNTNPNQKSLSLCTPKKTSLPPQEIMIDHLAVPPSPMREPNVDIMASPSMNKRLLDDQGLYLNFNDSSPRTPCLGDPVGDIAMHRQLKDAERLVRIVLGRPSKGDQNFLEPNTILQAIRSYALMKAELIELRAKQETEDGDPPAILQALGSPTATTPSKSIPSLYSPRRSVQNSHFFSDDVNGGRSRKHGIKSSVVDAKASPAASHEASIPSSSCAELTHAKEMIERLQKELKKANETILELKKKINTEENEENQYPIKSPNTIEIQNENADEKQLMKKQNHDFREEPKKTTNKVENEENQCPITSPDTIESQNENADEKQSMKKQQGDIHEEPKQPENINLLLNDTIHCPEFVPAENMVAISGEKQQEMEQTNTTDEEITSSTTTVEGENRREAKQSVMIEKEIISTTTPAKGEEEMQISQEELNLQLETNQKKQIQTPILDEENLLGTTMAQAGEETQTSRGESDQKVRKVENGLNRYDENDKKKSQAATIDKEHILESTTTSNKNNTSILMEVSHNTANSKSNSNLASSSSLSNTPQS